LQGRGGRGAIYTFAAGNGGFTQDSCAYNGYVNSIYTIAINGVNQDGSNPTYAEECPGIMASTYSRDTLRGLGKVVSKTSNFKIYFIYLFPRPCSLRRLPSQSFLADLLYLASEFNFGVWS